ncbi:class E sortase [Streptomyces sp. O3]
MARGAARRRRSIGVRGLWGAAEVAVTVGVVLLLLVVHQVWWTNREAQAGAARQVRALERQWRGSHPPGLAPSLGSVPSEGASGAAEGASDEASGGVSGAAPGVASGTVSEGGGGSGARSSGASSSPPADPSSSPSPSASSESSARSAQVYAILDIPRIGLRVPVAEGISKAEVLNKGYVGHYPETAGPGRAGNFALAGHRNTHGEPFRHIDRLRAGDRLTVETRDAVYAYVVDRTLPRTLPRDGSVIAPIPRSEVKAGHGYREPGYYLTLTTCTPEYSSKYRLVVWGKLKSVTPRA